MQSTKCREDVKKYVEKNNLFKDSFSEKLNVYFLMTQKCNLRCFYCYQSQDYKSSDLIMTNEMIDSAMSFVLNHFNEKNMQFSIFGGEPLLNFDAVKYIVTQYPSLRFIITTNGVILKQNKSVYDWIYNHSNNLKISISLGPLKMLYKEKFLEEIEPLLHLVKHNNGDVHIVVEDPNDSKIYDEIMHVINFGLPNVRINPPKHQTVLNLSDYLTLFKRLVDTIYFTDKPRFGVTQSWDIAFKNSIWKKKRNRLSEGGFPPSFCGTGYSYIAIDPAGDIWPCDYFASLKEMRLGNIYTGIDYNCKFFTTMRLWVESLYSKCDSCFDDIRLCPRSICLAENYKNTQHPLLPSESHCAAAKMDYELFNYMADKAIKLGLENECDLLDIKQSICS